MTTAADHIEHAIHTLNRRGSLSIEPLGSGYYLVGDESESWFVRGADLDVEAAEAAITAWDAAEEARLAGPREEREDRSAEQALAYERWCNAWPLCPAADVPAAVRGDRFVTVEN